MGRNREFDELLNKIDEIANNGHITEDMEPETDPKARDLLRVAEALANLNMPPSEDFKQRLKKKLMSDYSPGEKLALSEWSWSRFGAGARKTQLVALVAMLSIALLSSAALALPMLHDLVFKPTTGNIVVYSEPANATITIDGKNTGSTPYSARGLKVGTHRMSLSLENYEDWSANIEVKKNKTIEIRVTMTGIEVLEVKPTSKQKRTENVASSEQPPKANVSNASGNAQPGSSQGSSADSAGSSPSANQQSAPSGSATTGQEQSSTPNISEPDKRSNRYVLAIEGRRLVRYDLETGDDLTVTLLPQADAAAMRATFSTWQGYAVFQANPGSLFLIDLKKDSPKAISIYEAKSGETILNPSWSGSNKIVFGLAGQGNNGRIVELQIGGSEVRTVEETCVVGAGEPTGKYLALVKEDGLYIKETIGNAESRVFAGTQISKLLWSPNGRKLAFVGPARKIDETKFSLYVVDCDGSNLVEVDRQPISMNWSSNSERLVYEVDKNSRVSVCLFDTQALGGGNRLVDGGHYPIFDEKDGGCITFLKMEGLYSLRLTDHEQQEVVKGQRFQVLLYSQGTLTADKKL